MNLREGSMSTHWYDTSSRGERAGQFPSRSVLIRIEKQRSSSCKDGEHVPRQKYHRDRAYQLIGEPGPGSIAVGYVRYSSERKQENGAIQIIQASPGG